MGTSNTRVIENITFELNQLNQLNLLNKWLPIYYRFEETVGITLNQIRLGSVFAAHEYRIYLRELGGNFSYTTGFS